MSALGVILHRVAAKAARAQGMGHLLAAHLSLGQVEQLPGRAFPCMPSSCIFASLRGRSDNVRAYRIENGHV